MITFLHTSPVHIKTFAALMDEVAPEVPCRHVVRTALLDDARSRGLDAALTAEVRAEVVNAGDFVVCTCSTIGGLAEDAGALRIDRAMADRAVALGTRIVVMAALESTLAPTRALVTSSAERAGRPITLIPILLPSEVWAHFERGDTEAYLAAIAAALPAAAEQGEVVVLAQASMTRAIERCAPLPVPVLSSPRLGIDAALSHWRARGGRDG